MSFLLHVIQSCKTTSARARTALAAALLILPTLVCRAQSSAPQSPPAKTFTLDQAINQALEHYPALRAALERVSAARAGVALARTSYLPRADSLWQSNRATRNNIFGLI